MEYQRGVACNKTNLHVLSFSYVYRFDHFSTCTCVSTSLIQVAARARCLSVRITILCPVPVVNLSAVAPSPSSKNVHASVTDVRSVSFIIYLEFPWARVVPLYCIACFFVSSKGRIHADAFCIQKKMSWSKDFDTIYLQRIYHI
jgi:hypothetical protein